MVRHEATPHVRRVPMDTSRSHIFHKKQGQLPSVASSGVSLVIHAPWLMERANRGRLTRDVHTATGIYWLGRNAPLARWRGLLA